MITKIGIIKKQEAEKMVFQENTSTNENDFIWQMTVLTVLFVEDDNVLDALTSLSFAVHSYICEQSIIVSNYKKFNQETFNLLKQIDKTKNEIENIDAQIKVECCLALNYAQIRK